MKNRSNVLIGMVLILAGILLFLARLDVFSFDRVFSRYWASIFIVLPGLLFHYRYFSAGRKEPGLLGIGITLQISHSFDLWAVLWPG